MKTVTATATVTNSRDQFATHTKDFTYEEAVSSDYDRILTTEHFSAGLKLPDGQAWLLDKGARVTYEGNFVVEGKLDARGSGDARNPTSLEMVNIDESLVVGGGMEPLPNDWGLWCMGSGVLDFQGTPKTAWTNLAQGARKGDKSLELKAAPYGWQVGDEIVVTPTSPLDFVGFDRRTITRVYGDSVELDAPLSFDHPAVVAPFQTWTAEVLNLSRDIQVGGTEGGRGHVFVHSQNPQTLKYVRMQHLGPRRAPYSGAPRGHTRLGRWPLHLHHMFDNSRGTVVEGIVTTKVGAHAWVAHASNGVTFDRCIAHDVMETPMWWDNEIPEDASDEVKYLGCVASLVKGGDQEKLGNNSGFLATAGKGDVCNDCVCVGIELTGKASAVSGFGWSSIHGSSDWEFKRNLAHNIPRNGLRFWKNPARPKPIEGFEAYNCGSEGSGVMFFHGAYSGGLQSFDMKAWSGDPSVSGSIRIAASSAGRRNPPLTHQNANIGGGKYGFEFGHHNNVPLEPAFIIGDHIWDVSVAPVLIAESLKGEKGWYRFSDVVVHEKGNQHELKPPDFKIESMHPDSRYELKYADGTAERLNPDGTTTAIEPF